MSDNENIKQKKGGDRYGIFHKDQGPLLDGDSPSIEHGKIRIDERTV